MKTQTINSKQNKEAFFYFLAFLAAALCLFGALQAYVRNDGCDSQQYMVLSQSFENGGSFSFLHFPQDVSGYAFPFLLYLMQKLTPFFTVTAHYHHLGVELFSALAAMWLGSYFAARFLAGRKDSLRGRVLKLAAFAVLFYVFWKDLIGYPLSDLWPMITAGFSFVCLFSVKEAKTAAGSLIWSFLFGLSLYLTYNIRQSWLFYVPVALAVFLWLNWGEKRKLALCLLAAAAGMGLAALPQMLINHQNFGTWSPFVSSPVQGFDSMFLYHLYGGTMTNRVETHVLPQWGDAVTSVNRAGELLLAQAGVSAEGFGYGTYLRLLVRYFPDYIGIYMKHLVSLLTPVYTQIYIQELDSGSRFLVMGFHYLLYGTAAADILLKFRNGRYTWKGLAHPLNFLFLGFALPALSALPGYIEIRYGAPLILLIYLYVCYRVSWRELFRDFKKNWFSYCLLFLLAAGLCTAVMGDVLSTMDLQPMLLAR